MTFDEAAPFRFAVNRRDILKLASFGVLAAAGGFGAVCASASAQDGAPTPGGIWRMAITGNPTAYPITAPGALVDILVNKVIYNNLVQFQLEGEAVNVVPDLAESWENNADLTEFTFHLKSGITWHDGAPFTAKDVVFTMNAVMNPDVTASNRAALASVASVEAPDDATVKFTLKAPFADLPVMLGYNMAIVPQHLLEGADLNQPNDFLAKPIGTGPFKFKQLSQGDHLEVEKNAEYFEGAPLLDGIVFKVIPDGNARVAQVRSGEIDLTVVEPPQAESLAGEDSLEVREVPQVNYYFIAANHSSPKMQDVKVRQAFALALDKQAIVDNILKGAGQVATGPINPLLGDFYDPNVTVYGYDQDQAGQLLDQAGWTKGDGGVRVNAAGEKLSIRLLGPKGYPVMEQVLVYAQQEFQKLGAEVSLEIDEWTVHLDRYHKLDYDLLMQWWITPPSPDLYNHYFSESTSNWWAYKNPTVDDLVTRARAEPDRAARVDLYHQVQAVLADDVPVIYLYYPRELQALTKRTHDFVAMGYRDALTWSEKIWVDQ